MRRRSLLLSLAGAAAAPLATQTAASAAPAALLPAATGQALIVRGVAGKPTYATLQAFAKVRGAWVAASGSLPARIGRNGFSNHHREGDGTTPTGAYGIAATMYGIAANPGVRYRYHRLVSGDWWNENAQSPRYNSFQHSGTSPGGGSEALWRTSPQYTYLAVIAYNMPPTLTRPVPYRGSGIFLHQFGRTAGPTNGCVSLSRANLVSVLRWLDPARSPRIVLGA